MSEYLVWIYYALLVFVLVAGWLLNIFGLPGLWLMVLGHAAFAWATGWNVYAGWPSLITLIVLANAAEVIEFVAGAAGSKKAGGTRRGMTAAIIGGFVGGIVGSFVIWIPIVGAIIGAVAGSFIGAMVIERMIHPDSTRALRIGYGAAKGRLAGILIKSGIGFVMAGVSLIAALPLDDQILTNLIPPSTTNPATQPATTAPSTEKI